MEGGHAIVAFVDFGGQMKSKPCELYRHFDADGRLLYVGIAWCTTERLMGHKSGSHWFGQITRIEIERFPTRRGALDAETTAITNENPVFNIQSEVRRGSNCLSDEAKAEKREWARRALAAGVKVRANAALGALKATALAAEQGDFERARWSTAYLGLTQRLSTSSTE